VAEVERHFAKSCAATTGACFAPARGIIGTNWKAEEVVQDADVRAFRTFGTFRQEPLGTWLTRIVINEAQGRLRSDLTTKPWVRSSSFRVEH
jgi:DNA-directed RNA polymerase specialized sigma24 family protein